MSFGAELKRERELRSISLREVAEATKVNIRYLDALEHNDFEHLPGGVFNRGFVRAYAQYIGIDPESMVNAYLLEEQSQRQSAAPEEQPAAPLLRGGARGMPRRAPEPRVDRHDVSRQRRLLRWGLIALAVAVLVGAGLLLFDVLRDQRSRSVERPAVTEQRLE